MLQAAGAAIGLKALDALDGLAIAQKPPAFPRGSIIRTILADVNPDAIGATLFHEHLSLQDHNAYVPPRPAPAQLHYTENVDLVTGEIKAARADGLTCIVDAGHVDMGRNLESLRQIARGSGVHVVASGGYYLDRAYPPAIATSSEEEIAEDLVQQAARDRFGAFGEIGTSDSLTVNERRVFRAVGKAQVRTGLPVFTHNAVYKAEAHNDAMKAAMLQLDILESAGVNPQRVAIGHLCCHDDPKAEIPIAIAKRGAFVGFDRVVSGVMILPDEKRLQMALALLEAGHADKLLLSSDFSFERELKKSGAAGYAETLVVFVPKLRAAGVSDAVIRQVTVDNPRRLLAFVPKRS